MSKNKNELFKELMFEFMLNKSDDLEADRISILNRISYSKLHAKDYYDLIVNEVRRDYARFIFRQIRELMDMFL